MMNLTTYETDEVAVTQFAQTTADMLAAGNPAPWPPEVVAKLTAFIVGALVGVLEYEERPEVEVAHLSETAREAFQKRMMLNAAGSEGSIQ